MHKTLASTEDSSLNLQEPRGVFLLRRVLLFIAISVAAILAVGLSWLFAIDHGSEESVEANSPSTSVSQEVEAAETLTTEAATQLAERLVSQDETVYAQAWAHDNVPPMAPEGTTVVVNSVEAGESYAVIDVTFTMPDVEAVDFYLLVQLIDDDSQWQVYTMKAK